MATFSILGTGNMAHFMAKSLTSNDGYQFEGIWGRNTQKIKEFAQKYKTTTFQLSEIPDRKDHFCFVAVRDTAIQEVVSHFHFKHTILVHHAGSLSSNLLAQSAEHYGVLWPIYSIVEGEEQGSDTIPFVVESSGPEVGHQLSALVRHFSQQAYALSEQQRFLVHLSAVLCNNFCNHLIALAQSICQEKNIDPQCLQPILQQTFERLKQFNAQEVQTGPARRNDSITMNQHLSLLAHHPELQSVYKCLSSSIIKMYKRNSE